MARYEDDYKKLSSNALAGSPKVDLNVVQEAAMGFRKQVLATIKNLLLYFLLFCKPLKIYVTDHNQSLKFSLVSGLTRANIDYDHNYIAMLSDSLLYGFRFPLGSTHCTSMDVSKYPSMGALRSLRCTKDLAIASIAV